MALSEHILVKTDSQYRHLKLYKSACYASVVIEPHLLGHNKNKRLALNG
jgi:hypothetical protein